VQQTLRTISASAIALTALATAVSQSFAQQDRPDPVTVCDLALQPGKYFGKLVTVRGRVDADEAEYIVLFDDQSHRFCGIDLQDASSDGHALDQFYKAQIRAADAERPSSHFVIRASFAGKLDRNSPQGHWPWFNTFSATDIRIERAKKLPLVPYGRSTPIAASDAVRDETAAIDRARAECAAAMHEAAGKRYVANGKWRARLRSDVWAVSYNRDDDGNDVLRVNTEKKNGESSECLWWLDAP
jgi:hypothetical protein